MIEQIIQRIIQLLEQREKTQITETWDKLATQGDAPFLQAKTIRIAGVTASTLNEILSGENTPFRQWLKRANAFGVEVELQAFDFGEPWLCYKQIAKLPYSVFSACGDYLVHVEGPVICYRDVTLIPPYATLCKYKEQLITPLAKEYITKEQITIRERT